MRCLALAIAVALATTTQAPFLASAGTTGGISGVVVNSGTNSPIANAKITATSPTTVETTHTDARGYFCFVSLAPDRYVVTVERDGFNPVSIAGVNVFADQVLRLKATMTMALRYLSIDISRPPGRLVRRGTVVDIYEYSASSTSLGPPLAGQAFTLRMTPGITFAPGNSAPSSPL